MEHQYISYPNRLQLCEKSLSKTDQRIIKYIDQNLELALKSPIAKLATQIGVSTSSITRFIQKLDYRNFTEFQVQLNNEVNKSKMENRTMTTIHDYYRSIIYKTIEFYDLETLDKFIEYIEQANHILIIGIGSSGLTATEFQYRLIRMGFNATAITDSHQMLYQSMHLKDNDMLVVISNSGETTEVIQASEAAYDTAKIVSITQFSSTKLAKYTDIALYSASSDQINDPTFINTQLGTMFTCDVITQHLLSKPEYQEKYQATLGHFFSTRLALED